MDGSIAKFIDALGNHLDVAVVGSIVVLGLFFIVFGTVYSVIGTAFKQHSVRRMARDRANGLLGPGELDAMLASKE